MRDGALNRENTVCPVPSLLLKQNMSHDVT